MPRLVIRSILLVVAMHSAVPTTAEPVGALPIPEGVRTLSRHLRVDLLWDREGEGPWRVEVERAAEAAGPFQSLGVRTVPVSVFTDFLGEAGKTYYYRLRELPKPRTDDEASGWSAVVKGTSRQSTTEQLLTEVQEATFRYFWDFGHPVSGLARERDRSRDTCASGAGTGSGLIALCVGAQRGFAPRQAVAQRVLKIARFLQDVTPRYHGAWAHWINGRTGQTIPFASKNGVKADDGGDLVETAFLVQGLLTVRQYFAGDSAAEQEIRRRVTQLWREVEWDWYLREPGNKKLYWHWSPNHGWLMNHPFGGHFNECLIAYILGIASPTHPLPADCYRQGWIGDPSRYTNGNEYYGIKQPVGWPLGGPLFFTHYSFLGFDPRGKHDGFCNYFENNRAISLINRAYCADNPGKHKGYSELGWGLTASDTYNGYKAHAPGGKRDNGTLTPTAALSAMPYTPEESIATMRHFYETYGNRLWGELGFHDAFNLDHNWFASSYLAIDQGPIVCMIENYRTGLCWQTFMKNPEIVPALKAAGWTVDEESMAEK